ncbi:regulator of chromosome condensation 1/beta-lactamase-inhibitor protein II [Pelagophyceae sp. CCMP2097]|nr:regulator of chromosome condensation 1/beta-lactamase-inhibitor protein II [Pelagophyceae sp. CCMP2097]
MAMRLFVLCACLASIAGQAGDAADDVAGDVAADATAEADAPAAAARDLPAGFESSPPGSSVSAGHFHTCALRYMPGAEFGGAAHCWGMDEFLQVSKAPSDQFVQISAGHFHTCGITVSETIACWGDGREELYRPVGLFQQVSAGGHHSCGLTKDGEARCWGQDHRSGCTKPPRGRFSQVGAGDGFSCGLRPTGALECWGSNDRGEAAPPRGRFVQLAISTSSRHGCAVTYENNDVVCWGENRKGEAPPRLAGPLAQVAVGYKTTCVITGDGRHVDCYGSASRYFNTRDKHAAAAFGPDGRQWEEVSVGRDHICAVDSEGELFCMGQPLITAKDVPKGFVVA